MNISGLLILAAPAKSRLVSESLKKFPGLEVHSVFDDGRIAAVLERETTADEVKAVRELRDIDGVISASMVYHHFEEEVRE